MQFGRGLNVATALALTIIELWFNSLMKKVGWLWETITSTYFALPAFGPDAGPLLTVTVVPLAPFVTPFSAASARAAAVTSPKLSSAAPAMAALSAALCITRFARNNVPTSTENPTRPSMHVMDKSMSETAWPLSSLSFLITLLKKAGRRITLAILG
jgi:hypothetical protein